MADACRKKRTPIKAKLTRTKNAFAAYNKDLGLGTWAIQLGKLEPLYDEFDVIQTEIEMIIGREDSDRELRERNEFETMYFETVAQVREFVKNCQAVTRESILTDSPSTSTSQASYSASADMNNLLSMTALVANLPTLQIPKFDGSFKDWVRFRDSFKTMVHERIELSNIQKFHHLSSSLTGDAARVIQSLGVSDANYELAWKCLIDRYEDSRSLIHFHVKSLFELPVISKVTCTVLRQLIDDANSHLLALKALGENTEAWDTMVTYLLSTKLDFVTKREWEKRMLSTTEPPTYTRMIQFLEGHCKYLGRIMTEKSSFQVQGNQQRQMNVKSGNNKNFERLTSHATIKKRCLLCENSHSLVNCEKLLALPVNARIGQIAKLRVSFNCLKPVHRNRDCTLGPCGKCPGKHNTIIHIERNHLERFEDGPSTSQDTNNQVTKATLVTHSMCKDKNYVLLGTAIVYVKDRYGKNHECRALLDSCSQVNLMTQALCDRLKLPSAKSEVILSGVCKSTQEPQRCARVTLSSRLTKYSSQITCLVAPEITDDMPNVPLWQGDFKIPDGITLADPKFAVTQPIDMLIGGGLFWKLLCVGQIQLSNEEPVLQKTKLGWIVAGEMELPTSTKKGGVVCNLITNQQLHDDMQRFWSIEDFTNKGRYPQLDPGNISEQHFTATTERDLKGRFIVSMSFNEHINELGESFNMAHKRLLAVERKLDKDNDFKEKYEDFMSKQV